MDVRDIKGFSPSLISEDQLLGSMYEMLSFYVAREYSSKGKSITRWKAFGLRLEGESFNAIAETLGITYKSAIQYHSKCYKEAIRVLTDPAEYKRIFGKPLIHL